MNDIQYIYDSVTIPGSVFAIIGMDASGEAYALRERDISHISFYDLQEAFPLMSVLTHMAEAGEDVPDYDDVQAAIQEAKDRVKSLRTGGKDESG